MGDVYICAVTQIKHQMYCEYFFQLQKNLRDYLYIRLISYTNKMFVADELIIVGM